MMNQKEHTSKFSMKTLAISVVIQFLALILLLLTFSYFLLNVPKYENHMTISIWATTIFISFVNAWICKSKENLALTYAGVGSFLFSFICFAIGLLTARSALFLSAVLLRLSALILLSIIFTLIFKHCLKKKRKSQKFRFSK